MPLHGHMSPAWKIILPLLTVIPLLGCREPQDNHPGQPVADRRKAFKEIIRAFEPMGVMLRTEKYDAKRFQVHVGQLMTLRDGPWRYFGADTQYQPSHAKSEVWSDAAKFAAEKQAFFAATDKLAAVAGTTDKQVAATAYEAVTESCRSCHETFKTR
jgi:cytochrome c556